MHLKMSSAECVCCKYLPNITDELSIRANSLDPEHPAPIGTVLSESTLFAIEASLTLQQTRIADDFFAIGALRVKYCHLQMLRRRLSTALKVDDETGENKNHIRFLMGSVEK